MKQIVTTGIVLARTNFQEAERIVTLITPDHGKVRVLAKGVRKSKSKLAGGIELFSISDVTFLSGRGELNTLISSRLQTHFGNIVKDITRTMLGYELLKRTNRLTEDAAGSEYFELLKTTLGGLNNLDLPGELLELWFGMQLLKITGHSPNLETDTEGDKLSVDQKYIFSIEDMAFTPNDEGQWEASFIKLLRLAERVRTPELLLKVADAPKFTADAVQLVKDMEKIHLRA